MTLGGLLRDVASAEASFLANRQTAERQKSPFVALSWSIQANLFKWRPSPDSMPGIESIQLFCEERFGNFDLSAIRGMRAVVCRLQKIGISEANALPLEEVAHILDAIKAKPATATAELEPPKAQTDQIDRGQSVKEQRAAPAESDTLASKEERRAEWVGKALMLRRANPNMPKADIANRVGVHPGQLSPKRCPELFALENMLQGGTTSGHLTKDSETGLSDVEAAAPDDKPDWGKQISGSNYYREFCVECAEPMRVTLDQVGTGPRCDDCAP